MIRATFCLLALSLLRVSAAPEPANVQGLWKVEFTVPGGLDVEFDMGVIQNGTRLTGQLTSGSGEFPLRGTVAGDEVTIVWSVYEGGRQVEVTFRGKATGDAIEGTVKMGNSREGPLHATRVSPT
jgi:hypothetical protein